MRELYDIWRHKVPVRRNYYPNFELNQGLIKKSNIQFDRAFDRLK